jgi:hypothetical protein
LPKGISVGYRFQYFDYHEPSPGVREYGLMNGLGVGYEKPFGANDRAFYKIEGEFLIGKIRYDGHYLSGGGLTANSEDYTSSLRFHIGPSFAQGNSVVRLYAGLAGRHLYDYVQATGGYRREVLQSSLPLGIIYRRVLPKITFAVSDEVDILLNGQVKSYLSDAGPPHSNIFNVQRTGFGGRIAVTLEWPGKHTLILEPSFQYWMMADSDTDSDGTGNYLEPANTTKMYNLNFTVRF